MKALPSQDVVKEEVNGKLSKTELNHIADIYDFLKAGKKTWSLCKEHVQTVHKVIGDGRMGDRLRNDICILLQELVLVEDFVTLLEHEPTKLVPNFIQHFDEVTEDVQIAILKCVSITI